MTAIRDTTDQTPAQLNAPPSEERQLADQATDAEQRELWARYLEQQARRSCPGCGDDGVLF